MAAVVSIDTSPLATLDEPIADEKLISGTPSSGLRPAFDDEAAGFWSGVWASGVGSWRVAYDEIELCVLLEGRVRLSEDGGTAREFGPGEAFVIPRGFVGVWETIEPCRKIYAIVSAPA